MPDFVARLSKALEGRYQVDRILGEGGMATVYLADDLRHERKVALKVLKPELAAALGADRFQVEIKTTANLQHPHILPLFDSGEASGLLFYTMPYVQGETLRERLEREGKLSIEEAVRIASDVADALQAAHDGGVIHRDIKPSNILLSRGRALVADFGIAQAAAHLTATRLTQTGSSIGTAGYMSPEQGSGDGEVDPRSDIYSLACVLFEMLTGDPPYTGASVIHVLTQQITAPAPSVCSLRPETPPSIESALRTALSKEPARRFRTPSEFASALVDGKEQGQVGAPGGKVIVVLPFANRSADPDNEYFSDGLTDEVITDLSRVSALRVISRNSSMALKGTTKDTRSLARELGVTHLVTGSVRRAGTALRITADLVEARTDTPIWSEKFSGTVEDVFGIQEEISRKIVSALKVRLTDTEEQDVAERPIDDAAAYDCYLRARQVMYHWTPQAQERALRLVDEAISIAGETPLLLATKGQIHWNVAQAGLGPGGGLDLASELAGRALELDAGSYLAVFVRGLVAGNRGDTESALVDLYRAHRLRPSDANVLTELCRYSQTAGLESRRAYVERLAQVDPLTPVTHGIAAMQHFLEGRPSEAVAPARRAIELAPEPSMLHVLMGLNIASAGLIDEAIAILDGVAKSPATEVSGTVAFFLKSVLAGRAEEALRVVTPEMEQSIPNEVLSLVMVDGYVRLDRKKDALRLLRSAVRHGFIDYLYLSRHADFIDALGQESDFQEILAEVKPRWEAVLEWERSLQQ